MADEPKKATGLPSWQQAAKESNTSNGVIETTTSIPPQSDTPDDVLEVAREFLKDESIRDAPRSDKVEYLKEKGLGDDQIEKLLAEHQNSSTELKTVHDTSNKITELQQQPIAASNFASGSQDAATIINASRRPEVAPIITYPEFLLKPQKPPPLITVSRLVNAAYAIAGVSALTWGASKYIIEPMLQSLTEARHDLADTTLEDLQKFNEKLEGTVSHVPYIASSAVKRQQEHEEDNESIDSDPTELFHRDIATQTSPGLSRTASEASLNRHTLDPTIAQAERLSGLTYSLRNLVQSMEHSNDNEKHLQKTVKDFQGKLDTMESSYSMLKNDYYSSTSTYSSASNDAKKTTRENEAQKFKQEIRGLKGAFLSSRNFPTAPRATVTAGGYGAR